MNLTIDFTDEDFTEKEYQIEVEVDFEYSSYGNDADGNRGISTYEADWSVESVILDGQVYKPDLGLKKRIVEYVGKYLDKNLDYVLETYRSK